MPKPFERSEKLTNILAGQVDLPWLHHSHDRVSLANRRDVHALSLLIVAIGGDLHIENPVWALDGLPVSVSHETVVQLDLEGVGVLRVLGGRNGRSEKLLDELWRVLLLKPLLGLVSKLLHDCLVDRLELVVEGSNGGVGCLVAEGQVEGVLGHSLFVGEGTQAKRKGHLGGLHLREGSVLVEHSSCEAIVLVTLGRSDSDELGLDLAEGNDLGRHFGWLCVVGKWRGESERMEVLALI